MRTSEEKADALRRFNDSLLANDPELAEAEEANNERLEVNRPPEQQIALESIIMRRRRPVLAIKNGTTELEFQDPADIALWKGKLQRAANLLEPAIASVGRVELEGNPDFSWVGTGWLVHPRFFVTNRHVAEEFARGEGDKFIIHSGMAASLDLLQEIGRDEKQVFDVKGVSYIEPRPGLDLAFLEVEQIDGKVAKPITLFSKTPPKSLAVATIGYPAFDSRIPEPDLMREIYGNVFDKKRLAPGAITEIDGDRILHNCTTLGGNSGSVILDLDTGEALGLHFSGSFLRTNFAVRADRVKERLEALLNGTLRNRREAPARSRSSRRPASMVSAGTDAASFVTRNNGCGTASITVPLTITVSLGALAPGAFIGSPRPAPMPAQDGEVETGDLIETETKARPEDYENRKGYQSEFLGEDAVVELPTVVRGKAEILTWGDGNTVLPYEHFSVLMNSKRRQCFYSACNIDGSRSKGSDRKSWRFDPRIPESMQIMKECYGNAPKFSRGHMTRREDPAWGSTPAIIQRGADDSMHVTNATPQMQSFNAPIWLALEDFALQNVRQDDQKISVFTGPYFDKNDPTIFGVRIPVKFWKIIAFIHDETGELCATGYEMSQENNLEPLNPLRPRPFGGKGAEGVKKEIPSNKRKFLAIRFSRALPWTPRIASIGIASSTPAEPRGRCFWRWTAKRSFACHTASFTFAITPHPTSFSAQTLRTRRGGCTWRSLAIASAVRSRSLARSANKISELIHGNNHETHAHPPHHLYPRALRRASLQRCFRCICRFCAG